jgi:tetratricopeptide (TPR) repeat protein
MVTSGLTELASGALGERIRSLRRAAGMSQAELAGGRFSKEYVSQLERGKTRPSVETLEWLADRLGTDREFLLEGVSGADLARMEHALAEAGTLLETHRYDDALDAFRHARELEAAALPAFSLRILTGEAWAQTRVGDVDAALALLEEATAVAAAPTFSDVDRADVLFRIGVCRYSLSDISEAIAVLDRALALVEASGLPADALRSDIFHWRSRCHRRNRDWVAAREDIERALELAEGSSDVRRAADAYFQASMVAQREGRWVLARAHAERSKALFEELDDRATVARLLNNLAGLAHLLGDPAHAVDLLHEAFASFVELGLAVEAGYVCSSLADIHLDRGDFESAERQARKALDLLAGRVDHLQEVGTAQLALGRALAGQGRVGEAEELIATADRIFEQASSVSHRADAWVARGDLETQLGHDREAARLYRRAAHALLEPAF